MCGTSLKHIKYAIKRCHFIENIDLMDEFFDSLTESCCCVVDIRKKIELLFSAWDYTGLFKSHYFAFIWINDGLYLYNFNCKDVSKRMSIHYIGVSEFKK